MVKLNERDWLNKVLHTGSIYYSFYRTFLTISLSFMAVAIASLAIFQYSNDIKYLSIPITLLIGGFLSIIIFLVYVLKAYFIEKLSLDILHGLKINKIESRYLKICRSMIGVFFMEKISFGKNDKDKNIKKSTRKTKPIRDLQFENRQISNWQSFFTLVTVILMLITVIFTYQTVLYNEKMVDWYENPKPLLYHWSTPAISEDLNLIWRIGVHEYYKPEIGIENYPNERWSINVTIKNVGRAPLVNSRIYLIFSIDNINEENYPIFPFKIINYKNPIDSITFQENNNRSNQTMIYNDNPINYENIYGVFDFPPTIKYTDEVLEYIYPIPSFRIGALGVNEETWVYLQMFATKGNATGYVTFNIVGTNISPYPIIIPLESYEK